MSPRPHDLRDAVGTAVTLAGRTRTMPPEDDGALGPARRDSGSSSSARYRIRGEHARGGLGRVLRAKDVQLKRTVAIKELLCKGSADERRFEREALLTARLEHPSIVPVHELGRWGDGRPYYSMKMISGRTLREVAKACAGMRERLALLPNVLAVAEAIAYAHSQGVIHRDLKPANVIVGAYGETIVIDWGLAKDLTDVGALEQPDDGPYRKRADCGLTGHGDVLGTPAYMPPEQAAGEPVDERADIYALGAMLYRVLGGCAPFDGDNSLAILEKVRAHAPVPLEERAPEVPAELAAIVRKAMAREPRERYATADELAEDLKRFTTGQLVRVYDYSIGARIGRFARRNRAAVGVAAVMTLVLLAGGVWSLGRIVAEKDRAEAESVRARAEAARAKAAADALVLTNAESWLERDPTTAFAWVKNYAEDGGDWERANRLAVDAFDRGVARDIIQMNESSMDQIRWSPDGQWIATAGFDGVIGLWNVRTRQLRHINRDSVTGEEVMVFSPDSRTLFFATRTSGVAAHRLDTGETSLLPGHEALPLFSLAISRDGRYLAAGARSGHLVVWDLVEHTSRVRKAHPAEVVNMELADGATLVSRSWHDAAIWSLEDDRFIRLTGHKGEWSTVRLSLDQQTVVTASRGGEIKLWERATGTLLRTFETSHPVYEARFGDAETLFYSQGDDTVRKLDVRTGTHEVMDTHGGPLEMFAFQPGGPLVASIDFAGGLHFWSRGGGVRGRRVHRDREIRDLAFSPDGAWLAAGGEGGRLYIWPSPTLRSLDLISDEWVTGTSAFGTSDAFAISTLGGKAFVVSPDAERLVSRRVAHVSSKPVMVLSANSKRLVIYAERSLALWPATLAESAPAESTPPQVLIDDALIMAVRLSRKHRYLAAADDDGNVYAWALADEGDARLLSRQRVGGRVDEVAISDRGGRAVALRPSGELVIIDWIDGSTQLLDGPVAESVSALAISDDGRYAVGGTSRGVVLWDLDSGTRSLFEREGVTATSLRFAAEEHRVLMVSNTGVLYNWDLDGNRVSSVALHAGPASWASVSPVGSLLATAGRDQIIRIVDVHTGAIRTLHGHDFPIDRIEWSRDARHLISTSGQGRRSVYWDLETLASVPAPAATSPWLDQQSAVTVGPSSSPRALTTIEKRL